MRILGLDPGSERFGYGVIDVEPQAAPVYVAAGVLVAPGGWGKYRRLAELGRDIDVLLDEYLPNEVALEAGFVFRAKPAPALDAARGIGGFLAARRGLPVSEYAPAAVKKAITGSGRSEKRAVAEIVRARLGMRAVPDADAADALAVAITHAAGLTAAAVIARSFHRQSSNDGRTSGP